MRLLPVILVAALLAPAAHAQTSQATEIAQLRADLQRALVRIEMLERLILAAPPAAPTVARPAPASQPRSLMTPSVVDAPPEDAAPARRAAPASSNYFRGPKGGCYTFSASGRKRYVDRSLCN